MVLCCSQGLFHLYFYGRKQRFCPFHRRFSVLTARLYYLEYTQLAQSCLSRHNGHCRKHKLLHAKSSRQNSHQNIHLHWNHLVCGLSPISPVGNSPFQRDFSAPHHQLIHFGGTPFGTGILKIFKHLHHCGVSTHCKRCIR